MKKGTDTFVKQGNKKCPRCGRNRYGCKSETKVYNEKDILVQHYKMNKPFCSYCAFVEGDES